MGRSVSGRALRAAVALAFALCVQHAGAQRAVGQDPATDIRVQCDAQGAACRADTATWLGWRVFEAECSVCHARGGVGSTFAPALAPRVRRMSWADFVAVLDDGYRGVGDALPPHGERPNVARYYPELWRYLVARADGTLPAGTVDVLEEPD